MPVSSKEFLDIQATIERRFTLKHVHDMKITYSSFYDVIKIYWDHQLIVDTINFLLLEEAGGQNEPQLSYGALK